MKDWGLIIREYKKSEQLKGKTTDNLIWYLDEEDWKEFIEYCKRTTPFDPSKAEIITYMGVVFMEV